MGTFKTHARNFQQQIERIGTTLDLAERAVRMLQDIQSDLTRYESYNVDIVGVDLGRLKIAKPLFAGCKTELELFLLKVHESLPEDLQQKEKKRNSYRKFGPNNLLDLFAQEGILHDADEQTMKHLNEVNVAWAVRNALEHSARYDKGFWKQLTKPTSPISTTTKGTSFEGSLWQVEQEVRRCRAADRQIEEALTNFDDKVRIHTTHLRASISSMIHVGGWIGQALDRRLAER